MTGCVFTASDAEKNMPSGTSHEAWAGLLL